MHHTVYTMDLWVIDSHGAHTDIGLSVKVTDVNNHRPTPDKTEYHGQVPGKIYNVTMLLLMLLLLLLLLLVNVQVYQFHALHQFFLFTF